MLASFFSSMVAGQRLRLCPAILVLAVAGCSQPEADWPGTWRPSGANDQNLRAMLVNPQDAYVGSGAITSRGDTGARAVTRLLTDRRRTLLNASTSRVGSTSDSASDGPAVGGAAAQ